MLTHVVMFRFEDPADVPEALGLLRALAEKVPAANTLRVGTDLNGQVAAFDVLLVSEHDDELALQEYRQHPEHQRVLAWLEDHQCQRVAFDSTDL
ncbi:MAG: Dabb family protein [Actinomycetes bacterium]